MAGGRRHRTNATTIAAKQRQRDALELRKAGATLADIAAHLGYKGPSGAHKAIVSAMSELVKEPAEELRRIEADRLETLSLTIWKACTGTLPGGGPNLKAIETYLKLMDRRAKLLGLDMPVRAEVTVPQALKVETAQKLDVSSLPPEQIEALERILSEAAGVASITQADPPPPAPLPVPPPNPEYDSPIDG